MTQLVTMNVSVAQIEQDLRAGKSIEEIAQDWSEPRANVYAVKRAMDAAAAAPTVAVLPSRAPAVAPRPDADGGGRLVDLVADAAKSKNARTRNLGAKLDLLVEELDTRLRAEQADAAEPGRVIAAYRSAVGDGQ
jgi:hypothetical protein